MKIVPQAGSQSHTIEVVSNKTVLPNGIRIVTEEIPYVRSVSVGVWVNVGSRDESTKKNGISHFVEHMVFKGTQHYRMRQIAQSLESVGGYLNAFTTKENTCYYARVPDEHLPKAIGILSDLVLYARFDAKELDKEKQVVLEEIKNIEDDPDDLIHDHFDKNLFPKHSLGFPVIGTSESISELTQSDLFGHLRKHYVPGRMVVAVAGNLKHKTVVELVKRHFEIASTHGGRLQRAQASKHSYKKIEVRVEKPIAQAHICLGTIAYGVKSRRRYPLLVLNTLLGDGMSSRLFQNIREKYGFAYNIYSFSNFLSDTGNFGVYIGTDRKHIDNCIELIHKELNKLSAKPVSSSELKRTRTQIKGNMLLGLENMSSRMMRLGSGELYFGDCVPLSAIIERIDSVTAGDLLETASSLFDFDRFTTVVFKPSEADRESVPSRNSLNIR